MESWRHRVRNVLDIPDLSVAPSRFLAEKFIEAGFDRENIEIVPNFGPVPSEFPQETPLPGDMRDNYALFAGRLSPEKGLTTLIDAWRRMSPDAILRIAGTGPLEDELKARACGAENIEFMGFIEPERLAEIRRKARFLVIPSEWWENAPLTILEAFSDGIPVLGSNIGGIPEMVRPGETGELFEPGNRDDLTEKAKVLLGSPDLCAKLGREARQVAITEYSPEIHIERIEKIYRRLIKTPGVRL